MAERISIPTSKTKIVIDLPPLVQKPLATETEGYVEEKRDPGDYPLRYWTPFEPRRKYFIGMVAAIAIAVLTAFCGDASAQGFGPPRIVQSVPPIIGRNAWVGGSAFIGSQIGRYYGGYPGAAAGWIGGRIIGGSIYDPGSTRYYYPRNLEFRGSTPFMVRPYR